MKNENEIILKPFCQADAVPINKMREIESYENMIGGPKRYVPLERDIEWVRSIILSMDDKSFYFAIRDKKSDQFLGYVSVTEIDYRSGNCFWSGIKLIPEARGKGVSKKALNMIFRFVFDELRMERCTGRCIEENMIAERMMLSSGMKKEGLLRKNLFKNGEFHNTIIFSILREEWETIKNKTW